MFTDYFRTGAFTSWPRSHRLSRLRKRYLYLTPRYLRYLDQTIVMTPWAMGVASLCLFAFVPQMQEIYISVIEDCDFTRGALGVASLAVFSALLYYLNLKMITKRIDGIYPDHADIHFDRQVIDARDSKTMIAASFPFVGVTIGLIAAYLRVKTTAQNMEAVTGALGDQLDRTDILHASLQTLPHAILLCIGFAIVFVIGLMYALHASRNNSWWQRRFLVACYALTFVLFAVPVTLSNTTLVAARFAGPLASTGFVLIAVAVFLRLLIVGAGPIIIALRMAPSILFFSMRRRRFALRHFVVALVPVLFISLIGLKVFQFVEKQAAVRTHNSPFEDLSDPRQKTAKHKAKLHDKLASWIGAREIGAGDYPVFIVTAQGGGMYAASAASFFLAKMEERCPGFADHIFAVSAVSGGSIGASLFNAALSENAEGKDASRVAGRPSPCLEPKEPGRLFERLRKVTGDDHLSPVLAYILPDLVRDIGEFVVGPPRQKDPCKSEAPFTWFARDQILEKSFIASFEQSGQTYRNVITVCPAPGKSNLLMRRFGDSWADGEKLPALLLNATWVETGYRVAFSPFPLQHIGEGTLYSFDDVGELPGEGHKAEESWQNPSLIRAAAVSARFPFILPPWVSSPDRKNHWSFVDGGYADSSGATTGLELYLELKRELAGPSKWSGLKDASGKDIHPDRVKLYLISLTDAYAEPDYGRLTGTAFDDFIAPLNTLLTVRELLAQRAVTRAHAQLAAGAGDEGLITIQLDQLSFSLPLGWKQSRLSSDVIRFAMGRPESCDETKKKDADTEWPVWTVNHNSCELRSIIRLLEPPDAAQAPAPQQAPASPAPAQQPLAPAVPAPKTFGSWQVTPQ